MAFYCERCAHAFAGRVKVSVCVGDRRLAGILLDSGNDLRSLPLGTRQIDRVARRIVGDEPFDKIVNLAGRLNLNILEGHVRAARFKDLKTEGLQIARQRQIMRGGDRETR